jgi:tRNA(Arg) A34 adenosine deaminase TadA
VAPVDTRELPTSYEIRLPAWVADELADVGEVLPSLEDRMRVVHALAGRNFLEGGGGPFAAIVVERDSGRLVSAGVNVVLARGISSGHAEVTALGLAQTRVDTWDLGADGLPAHQLVVNWRPCVQCYGATLWSGVRSLVVAGDGPELEQLTGFDEGPMVLDWRDQFRARGIEVVGDVLRAEAVATWQAYADHVAATGATVYNARAGAPDGG